MLLAIAARADLAESLLTEIQRLRAQLAAVESDLAAIEGRIRRARAHLARD